MKTLTIRIGTLTLFLLLSTYLVSQINSEIPISIIPSGAGLSENQELSLEWTLGEPVAQLIKSNDLHINQGFQQYHFNDIISAVSNENNLASFHLFPNPALKDFFIRDANDRLLNIKIYSNQGELVFEKEQLKSKEAISINNLSAGIYHLSVSSGSESLGSKILIKL